MSVNPIGPIGYSRPRISRRSPGDLPPSPVAATGTMACPMAVHVLALRVDLHLPASHSLKDKRAVVKTILEGARRRFQVAAAETDHHDRWQRA